MNIAITKMHGAGNDFIVVDDRFLLFPISDSRFVEKICTRRTGIGSDGVLLIQPSTTADLKMRFINPDGYEVQMCGNGARCFARRAFELGAAPSPMVIETAAGLIRADIQEDQVQLTLTDPMNWRMGLDIGLTRLVDFVNTGVPHVVVRVDDLETLDLQTSGRSIRCHDLFSPDGTNVNFIKVEIDGSLSIRTYERGVEAETLACGTGATAAAVIAARQGWVELPVAVHCAGGYDLIINSGSGGTILSGGAVTVFEGEIEYGNRV